MIVQARSIQSCTSEGAIYKCRLLKVLFSSKDLSKFIVPLNHGRALYLHCGILIAGKATRRKFK